MFRVETVADSELGSKNYLAKLITTQQITKLDGNVEFTLIATVIFPFIDVMMIYKYLIILLYRILLPKTGEAQEFQ